MGNEFDPPYPIPGMPAPPPLSRSDLSWVQKIAADDWGPRARQSQRPENSSRIPSENIHKAGARDSKTGGNPLRRSSRSRERTVEVFENEVLSGISERERMAELGARHVAFRSTPSMRSVA